MTCPHCGAEVAPGNTFCHRCRKRVVAPGSSGASASRPATLPSRPVARPAAAGPVGGGFRRPGGITAVAVANILPGLTCLVLFAGTFTVVREGLGRTPAPLGVIAPLIAIVGALAVLGLLYLVSSVGLFTLKRYGRLITLVLAGVGVLGIVTLPAAILAFMYLLKPGMVILFSGRRAATLSVQERQALEAATSSKLGLAIAALTVLPCLALGGIAVIGIPSLLRARVATNESSALGDLRTLVSAQAAYQSASKGVYAPAECLTKPDNCLPDYQGPSFWGLSTSVNGTRNGYVFKFHPGPVSGIGLTSFAYAAEPVSPGQTGKRRFCTNESGLIGVTLDPSHTLIKDGRCSTELQPLR